MFGHVLPELKMGLASLFAHKLRSLLTMLGMIFGVGAVVAMLSITAGAQKQMMSFIDQLGVNNIIVDAHEAVDRNELQTVRSVSPGLTFRDYRAISENVQNLVAITPRKKFKPQKLLPKTNSEPPARPFGFARANLSRLSRHLRKRPKPGGHYPAQEIQAAKTPAQDQFGTPHSHRRLPQFRRDQQPQAGRRRPLLQ